MTRISPPLSPISTSPTTTLLQWQRTHFPEVATTMECCPEVEMPPNVVQLVTTDFQTAGHGQRGTSWESDRGKNLTFSFRFSPQSVRATEQFFLSEIACLAVAQTLDAYVPKVTVKWPNDVYVGDKKICGMLLYHTLRGANIGSTLVGIGINVNQPQFCSDAPNPISLCQLLEKTLDCEIILQEFMQHFEQLYALWCKGDKLLLSTTYAARLYRRNGFHPFRDTATGETFAARIEHIAPDGLLSLCDRQGRLRTFTFKAVQFLPQH